MRWLNRNISGMVSVALAAVSLFTARAQQLEVATAPAHLTQAIQLVDSLHGVEDNHYGGGKRHIEWEPGHSSARTVCSSFTTLLLEHTYGWTDKEIRAWVGESNPMASVFHDEIVAKNRFLRIVHVKAIRPGDILAVKYTDHHVSSNGVEDTGHVMIVALRPMLITAQKPVIEGTEQYLVAVIDSSASGHGPRDTRHKPDGTFTGGIGRGEMRLYADADGKIAGYTWSATPKSPYLTAPDREMVAGRLKEAKPDASN